MALMQTGGLSRAEVDSLAPYALFEFRGKHVIHPCGRRATEQLFDLAALTPVVAGRWPATQEGSARCRT